MTLFEIKQLTKNYGKHQVLQGIDLTLNENEITTIIGPSGSGKSTLLRTLNLLEEIQSGSILYKGQDIHDPALDINRYRSQVGMIFQQFNLFNHLTVIDNCNIAQVKVLKRSANEAEQVSLQMLDKVGLKPFAKQPVTLLSGGQKQRVAIARTLCMNPEVLLLDEPTSALDPQMVDEVLEVIKDLSLSQQINLTIVTHEMRFAKEISDRIIFMMDGQIVEDQSAEVFFHNPSTPQAQQFIAKYL